MYRLSETGGSEEHPHPRGIPGLRNVNGNQDPEAIELIIPFLEKKTDRNFGENIHFSSQMWDATPTPGAPVSLNGGVG